MYCQCNDLASMLVAAARSNKGITFIKRSSHEEFISYNELYNAALKGLWFLQSKGMQPKDELVFQLDDNRAFLITFWACILGGIVPVPLSIGKNDDHKQKLFNVWPVLNNPFLVATQDVIPALREFAASKNMEAACNTMLEKFIDADGILSSEIEGKTVELNEHDIAFIQFSSGSTGSPKGVALTHRNLLTNIADISTAAAYSPDDATISWMPLTHDMGLIGFHLNPLFAGMDQYLIATADFVRNPALWMDKASEHKITVLCSPNFGYKFLLKHCEGTEYNWDLSAVRILYNGAEPISTRLGNEFLAAFSKYGLKRNSMCPVYGLAEASLAVSISGLQDDVIAIELDRNALNFGDTVLTAANETQAVSFVNVGKAIDNCLLRIADNNNRVVHDEVIGHIQIKGDNVTSGYYNNATETAKVIAPDGWLTTGDLGFMKDGALYITGRAKDIIFVNGQNYYPHDIERVAEEVEGIELNKIAVAGFFNAATQKEETIAFVFHRGSLESFVPVVRLLKAHVNNVTGFELDRVIAVTNIPRTTSGKLQRFKLLEQYHNGEFNAVEGELCKLIEASPTFTNTSLSDDENALLKICANVLKTSNINIDNGFFEQGGNSLKAAELAMAIAKELKVELPVELIYETQSLKALAAEIKKAAQQTYTPIPFAQKADYYPATPAQEQIYYAWKLDAASVAYNIPVAFEINGNLDIEQLQTCIKQLIRRNDCLRMCFSTPGIKVQDDVDFTLESTAVEKSKLDETLQRLVRPFDLSAQPLFRIQLLQLSAIEYILFTDFHHIIADGISVYNFISDLLGLYNGRALTSLPVSYTDYACWEKENSQSAQQENYWLNQLAGELPLLELPTDFKRPVLFNTTGKKIEFSFDNKTAACLKHLAAANNVSLHVLMFTIYNILLSKYAGQDDVIVGIPVSGRRHPDLQGMFGMFVNNLAVRTVMNGNDSFMQLLQQQKHNVQQALSNQDYPFGNLVHALGASRDVSRNPVFDTMFIYQNMGFPQSGSKDFTIQRRFFDPGFSKYDLSLEVFEDTDSLKYYIEFCTALFNDQTILRLQQHFGNLVNAIINNPTAALAELSLLNNAEFNEQINLFNATTADYPKNKTIHQLFHQQVEKTPCAVALEHNGITLTYRELDDQSNHLAALLRARGVTTEVIVAVLLERSPELVIALLAILKAGGAYLPMDTGLPAERIATLVATSKCQLIITKGEHVTIQLPPVEVLRMDFVAATSPGLNEIEDISKPSDLAYVLYTSGTTGVPKGVMIAHQSVVNYITWAAKNYIKEKTAGAFPLFTSISFDLTVTSIFTPLLTGNRIVIYEESGNDLLIERIIADNKVDVIKLTPSHLKLLVEIKTTQECKAKTFIVGGENLDTSIAKAIHDKFGNNISIFNEYGPTETTVGCMIYQYNPADQFPYVPIGIPADNIQIYLLDKFLKPVPAGATGELYISGDGLARGYLFNEALTQQKFIPNPFIPGKLMYRTGDMAKRTPEGQIIFIGRIDQQVKINGYRIELAEIENHLTAHPSINEAAVIVRKNICAYYKTTDDSAIEAATLRTFLAQKLPHYMLPVHFVQVDEIPLNRNGKRDYAALPDLVRKVTGGPLPKNRVEELSLQIWQQVLAEQQLSVTDNFFELGGDSIKALQITSRLLEQGIVLNVKDILTYHTIEQISAQAKIASASDRQSQDLCEGRKSKTPIESWFFAQQFTNPHHYNQSILLALNKNINPVILATAFEKLIEHHDGLRLNYDPADKAMFYNNAHLQKRFNIEISSVPLAETCLELKSSFNITRDLLIKAAIINNDMLFITAHHLVMDGVSWRILLEDLHAAYTALEQSAPVKLPLKTASLSHWQKSLFENPGLDAPEKEADYWKLAESFAFAIPQDFSTNDWRVKNASNIHGSLNAEATHFLLRDAHRAYNTDVPILLNTALALALREWTGFGEIVIEQENHGRHLPNINASRTIGWFTAMYPLKLTVAENSLAATLMTVKEQMRNLPNHGIGYGIYKTMGLLESYWSNALTPVRLNYLGQFDSEVNNNLFSFLQQDTGSDVCLSNNMSCVLELNCMIVNGGFELSITYNQGAHTAETILQFKDAFFRHLQSILNFLEGQEDIQFTPSDFDAEALSSEDLEQLFG